VIKKESGKSHQGSSVFNQGDKANVAHNKVDIPQSTFRVDKIEKGTKNEEKIAGL
jgi:hypothetical protein